MDYLIPEVQVLVWTIVVFIALVAILKKFAWGPLLRALDEREQRIARRIADAEAKDAAAQARLAEYEKRLLAAKEEAAGLIAEGKRAAENVAREVHAAAEAEAARGMERAKREIRLAKEAAIHELREQLVGITAQIAAQVIRREVKEEDHRRFIREAMAEVEKQAR